MPIGPSALSAECTQVRKICCALSAECTPELGVMSAVQSAVVHCVWSCFRFPLVLVRTGRRLPVQALGERRVLVAVTGYPRGGAPGPG